MLIQSIFLDLDGVLSDWVSSALRVFNLTHDDVSPDDLRELHRVVTNGDEDAMWAEIDKHGEEFWSGLSLYDWSLELWETCRSVAPTCILTKPSRSPYSASGKVRWITQHFKTRSFLIGPPKHFCARPGALLVDDYEKNCLRFKDAGGEAIVFPQPYNMNASKDHRWVLEKIKSGRVEGFL